MPGHPDKRAICAEQLSTLKSSLLSKPLHGKYTTLLQSDSVDGSGSSKWLQQHLHSESESTVLAIQDQVIATRGYEAKIMNKSIPSRLCRVRLFSICYRPALLWLPPLIYTASFTSS